MAALLVVAAVLFVWRLLEPPPTLPNRTLVREIFPSAARIESFPAGYFAWDREGAFLGRVLDGSNAASRRSGYGGPVPFLLGLDPAGRVAGVVVMGGRETPAYLERVVASGLPSSWNGRLPAAARGLSVQAVSGATITSSALIGGVRDLLGDLDSTASPAAPSPARHTPLEAILSWSALVLGLLGFLVFRRSSRYRLVALAWTFAVLGLIDNAGFSLELLLRWARIDPATAVSAVGLFPLVLLGIVVVLNLATGKNAYCAWFCPFGAAQELVGRAARAARPFPPRLQRLARWLPSLILTGLVLLAAGGLLEDLSGVEPFAAFRPRWAPRMSLLLAGAALAASLFWPRPWCRLLCPTGRLFDLLAGRRRGLPRLSRIRDEFSGERR